jgi:hypothetical protein
MPRKKKTIHYLYKTTCTVTNKYYVGIHSTINLDDNYLGSGKRLRYSIRKYGKENHIKEILEFFDSREGLLLKEKEIVNEDFLKDKLCLNLQLGGGGGFCNKEHAVKAQKQGALNFVNRLNTDVEFRKKVLVQLVQNKIKATINGSYKGKRPLGIKHTEDSKRKIGRANKKYKGEQNSQFGTCWITKDSINKKIKKEDLNNWLILGWIKGRYVPSKLI